MINSLSSFILHRCNGYIVIVLFVCYLLFPTYILSNAEKELTAMAGLNPVLDLKFFYSSDDVSQSLQALGETGRAEYSFIEKVIDPIYMLAYSLFFSFLIAFSIKKIKPQRNFNFMIVLPFIVAFCDLIENIFLITIINNFPSVNNFVVAVSSIVTSIKWIAAFPTILGALSFFLIMLVKQLTTKKAQTAL